MFKSISASMHSRMMVTGLVGGNIVGPLCILGFGEAVGVSLRCGGEIFFVFLSEVATISTSSLDELHDRQKTCNLLS
jgi:hypothetical protein